ncbi:Response regulator receiver domain protein,histidine kinase [Rhizobium leguminosarum bv. trifolii WSM597]|uniref:histidine kinase n=4 Tax=Rhizobium TaxID=379 RepID=A0ABF7QV26_RHILW|nr:histidine kinase [Rhizobium leguminosarum bv. trifolii WSM2304]EJB06783.1 Response regulator receiver domain protein,histidine kinase [Rhizobium leguminosarum bv. trifolii WSM597]
MARIRSVVLLALAATMPVVLLGGFFGQYLLEQQKASFDQEVSGKATALALALERELATNIQLLAILSESPRLDGPIDVGAFAEIARRLQIRVPNWSLLRITDLDGSIIATVPARDAKTVAEKSSLRRLKLTGEPVVGNLVKGPVGNFGFPVRVPITRNGKASLALTAVVRPGALSAVLSKVGLKEGQIAWVTDGAGLIAASSDGAKSVGLPEAAYGLRANDTSDGHETSVAGTLLRTHSMAIGDYPWRVTVGMPLSQFSTLSEMTTGLLWATILATVCCAGFAYHLFQRERTSLREQENTVANAQRMDALGKLTGQVAHDFNNLLMVFQAGTSAIQRVPDDVARRDKVLESMADGVARGRELTQRLMSFSSKSNKAAEVADLVRALQDVKPLLRQAVNDLITFELAVDSDLWTSKIERKSLEIALINIVSNARDAITGTGRITLQARNVLDGAREAALPKGQYVALTVVDTGKGMEPAVAARAVEPLFSTKAGLGAGLGLTQASRFAERSGGRLIISSVNGVGTSVTIYLPRARDLEGHSYPAEAGTMPRRLLVVDDTPASLESAKLSVEGEVEEVITASNAQDALVLLRTRTDIDGLLSDVMMPGMSGIELAEIARRIRPSLQIVLMTGYSDKIEDGQKIDFQLVGKPFTLSELVSTFANASRERHAHT